MNNAKEIFDTRLKKVESYLNTRSKRELILLFIFCFLIGFMSIFTLSFEGAKQSLEEKNQLKLRLEKELFSLQDTFKSTKKPEDMESLQDSIQALEQNIALQDKQKLLLQKQSSVYALTQIADSKNLQDFTISQENQSILLSAKGKYRDFFNFLENVESQSRLEIHSLSLYPNASRQNLEFYLELLLHKKAEKTLSNSQRNLE